MEEKQKTPHLSGRLSAIEDLLARAGSFRCVADVGCDHGFLSIRLIADGIAEEVIASDVREGPLSRAKEHVSEYGFSQKIRTVLSDGMRHLSPGEADAAVIAGMGGLLMRDIIMEAATRKALPKVLLLQPQSHPEELRAGLRELGYGIAAEDMVLEDGKFYPILRAERSSAATMEKQHVGTDAASDAALAGTDGDPMDPKLWQKAEDLFGPCLLKAGHPVLLTYLQKQKKQFAGILGSLPAEHENRAQIEDKLRLLEAALRGGNFDETGSDH